MITYHRDVASAADKIIVADLLHHPFLQPQLLIFQRLSQTLGAVSVRVVCESVRAGTAPAFVEAAPASGSNNRTHLIRAVRESMRSACHDDGGGAALSATVMLVNAAGHAGGAAEFLRQILRQLLFLHGEELVLRRLQHLLHLCSAEQTLTTQDLQQTNTQQADSCHMHQTNIRVLMIKVKGHSQPILLWSFE